MAIGCLSFPPFVAAQSRRGGPIRYHSFFPMGAERKRVISVGPMPPEKSAFALARYSRSPDSIHESLDWVRRHDSEKFLESYYFQYGHASIADLGHVMLSFEGISELAATEVEDEQLWDGQARSSRYQDFSKCGFLTPPELIGSQAELYRKEASRLLDVYRQVHEKVVQHLADKLPRPEEMSEEAYQRNLSARAFDVARYLLFWGVPTNVGQVTSIRTLERQARRLKASEYQELRELASEIASVCSTTPDCVWDNCVTPEPLAPTLARHLDADEHLAISKRELSQWVAQNLPSAADIAIEDVDLLQPEHIPSDVVATLLYSVTDRPYRELYEMAAGWNRKRRQEVLDVALGSRGRRDDLLRAFRGGPYVYDIVMDIGAYRDLHRHRRCQQFRQPYGSKLGFATPAAISETGLESLYAATMEKVLDAFDHLPAPASHYLLPFATRSRFLFKMDFAEVEYVSKLRSGVKGHFSYREVAWEMKLRMEELEPELGRLIDATPPSEEDPLRR